MYVNVLTARWKGLALQEALSAEGLAEYLRERWRQLTGSGHQLQSPERVTTEESSIRLKCKQVKTCFWFAACGSVETHRGAVG